MNFYSNENNVENHFDNINGSSFNYNSFIGDENSSDDYPQQFTFNKYRSEFLSPFPYIDYSTAPQSNLFEDLFFPKKGEENNLDDFNDIQKDSNENKVICEINKDSLENRKQPLGRPPLNNNSYIGKHSNKAADNGSKKIIRCCIKSIFECFQKEIKLYSKSKKIRIRKLHIPTIKNYLNKGNSEKYSLFNSSMKTIFIENSGVDGICTGECELGQFIPQELIRKDVMLKSLNYVEQFFKSGFLITADDTPMNIMAFHFAQNYSNINIPGYLYTKRIISMSRGQNKELDQIRGYNFLLYYQ